MNMEMEQLVGLLRAYEGWKRDEQGCVGDVRYSNGAFHFRRKPIDVTSTAARQLCQLAGVPTVFFNKKLTERERSSIFNRLMRESANEERLYRFHGDCLYGVVSPKYKKLDNVVLVDVIAAAEETGLDLRPIRYNLHPDHSIVSLVPVGNTNSELVPVIEFTNSENGLGSLQVWSGIYRWICSNGMVFTLEGREESKWLHIGGADFKIPALERVLSSSVVNITHLDRSRSFYLSASQKMYIAADMWECLGRQAAEKVIEIAQKEYKSGRTLFDVLNAITRTAQFFTGATRFEMERYAAEFLMRANDELVAA
ncbi:MAG: DUF932 domain-containing protein [bacterium]